MYHPAELKDVAQMCLLRQLLNSPHRNLCFRPQRWMKCDLQVWSLMWLFYFSLLYKKQTNIITPKTDRHHNAQNHSLYTCIITICIMVIVLLYTTRKKNTI